MEKECNSCGEVKEHHAKGMCGNCYKRLWNPDGHKCKRCERTIKVHAKGLCAGCYNFVFRSVQNKAWTFYKKYGLPASQYRKITKCCIICGFEHAVDLHHVDLNKQNNEPGNLVGLCPNHHRMIHSYNFTEQILDILRSKGYVVPDNNKIGYKHDG